MSRKTSDMLLLGWPWAAPAETQHAAGIKPIVDLSDGRTRALAALAQIKG